MFSSRTASGTSLMPSAQQRALNKLNDLLHATVENQSCADCSARLSDSIWASTTVGAFLCIHCAGCHRNLGVQLSRVKSLHLDTWSEDEVMAMKGGNKRVQQIYGKFLDKWIATDRAWALLPNADAALRESFIRVKYEDMQFTKLPCSLQEPRPSNEEKGQDCPEVPEDTAGSSQRENQQRSPVLKPRDGNQDAIKPGSVIEVSKRFINYFVVLGRGTLVPNQCIEKTKSPTDIQFIPTTVDMYPEPYADSPLPAHVAQFAFPEGFALSQTYIAPVFFSFVLTNVCGVRIYACALKFYEELHPLEVVSLIAPQPERRHLLRRRGPGAAQASNEDANNDENNNQQSTELPKWVQDLSGDMTNAPGPVYCPKCMLVTSHYPYFSAYRQFLKQIYQVSLSQSPMPIERYIANFVSEIPLPPQGKIQVQLTLPDRNLVISRPPKNEFPLVDFSFRPLFQTLDMNNILLVFSCLVLEYKIVLCSKYIALLTPVAETLLALLLPFSWQGAYIPVLPASLLDVIDAPVPFLVGTHADCLKQAAGRTSGVVFVDLDHNRVIPAVDESGKSISIPKLPEREGAKLRVKLAQYANIFDPFAAGMNKVDLAFPNEEYLEPIGFASERGQTIPFAKSVSESSITETLNSIYSMGKIMRGRRSSNASSAGMSSSSLMSTGAFSRNSGAMSPGRSNFASISSVLASQPTDLVNGLTESSFNETETFSTEGVRKAFLRFFVTLLKKYALYLKTSSRNGRHENDPLFDSEAFLRDHDTSSRPFVAQLLSTQMFDRFIEDRVMNPQLSEVLFFDQSISQKLNRSLSIGKKKYNCSFLDDRSQIIQETFIAPPPSNIGLPDDGTIYSYKSFPRMKRSLFGNVRKPRELFTTCEQQRNVSRVDLHQRLFTMSKNVKTSNSSWEATRRLIVHLQTQYRMYSARKKYQTSKDSAIIIQRWMIAHIKGGADRRRFLQLRFAAIVIQKECRMHIAQKLYVAKQFAVRKIQFFAQGYIAYARYQRVVRGFRRLQAQWRSSFHKKTYKNLKYQIIRVQSRIRGILSRNRTMSWKEELFESFRRKIFDLWEQCDVPLLHRSKFWLTFNRPDFFNLGIYLEEERRLQAYFRDTQAAHDAYEYSTQPEKSSANAKTNGIRKATVTALKQMLQPKKNRSADRKNIGDIAVVRVEEERAQIYEALRRQTSEPVRNSFYEQFHIAMESKTKKRRLANLVWTTYKDAGISAEIIVTISTASDRYHPLPAQIDRHKQLRIREDLAFTVNAALKSIRYATRTDRSSLHPNERELIELQHQVRMLASQNHRLMGDLANSQREMSRLQMELQLQQQPQLRKVGSDKSL